MEQTGRVVGILPSGRAQVEIQRRAACASDCEKCGGCSHPEQTMLVEAPNGCGAKSGGKSGDRSPYGQHLVHCGPGVSLMPVLLMIACYFVPVPGGEGVRILCSLAGLAIGTALCMLYSRRMKKNRRVLFEIRPLRRG